MGKPELGTKCICVSCGERFYDLNRAPATCPKCSAEQPPPVAKVYRPIRASAGKGAFDRRPRPVVADEAPDAVDDAVVDDVEEAADPDDDVVDPDDDDDDAVVIEINPDHDKSHS